ncbi:quinone oxidoreductase family protein [Nitratireductor luteus]|uniref:quinone oxidoreductase family protein n=1 Tax=Nitratireductor luteus TaxID=2976980 RepID=UPI002240D558|nr:zinc-binding dehydrogenase [Nitratireductor luteus]
MNAHVVLSELGGPKVLTFVPAPELSPGPQEVLVRNAASGVNFIDTIIRRGALPTGAMPALPHILGVEGSGVVEAIGADVEGFVQGDHVVWMGGIGAGGYATHSVLSPKSLAKVPKNLDLQLSAALPVAAVTSWQILVRVARVKAGETVLVRGAAGGVGTMLIQLAKHLGAQVIAITSSSKRDFALAAGADHALSHADGPLKEEILRLTDGRGVDVACNPVSGGTIAEDLRCLAPFGRIVIFGFLAGEPKGAFSPDLVQHFGKSVSIHVSDVYTLFNTAPTEFIAALNEVVGLYANGVLRPKVHGSFLLSEAWRAHELIETSKVMGKLLIEMPS